MPRWTVTTTSAGLRLRPIVFRGLESRAQTWADLFSKQLDGVRAFVLYFPSRADTEADKVATEALTAFGTHTGAATSVNFWDPTDDEFSRALGLFNIDAPPALVFVPGKLLVAAASTDGAAHLYSIAITDESILRDRDKLVRAANTAHEVVIRGDPGEISAYVRERKAAAWVAGVARVSASVIEEFAKLKPRLSLPGGIGFQLG